MKKSALKQAQSWLAGKVARALARIIDIIVSWLFNALSKTASWLVTNLRIVALGNMVIREWIISSLHPKWTRPMATPPTINAVSFSLCCCKLLAPDDVSVLDAIVLDVVVEVD